MRLPKSLLILSSSLLIGCASSSDPNDQTEEVTILSKPKGAMVEINGTRVGRTPITVELDRTENHEITIDKSGYEPRTTTARPSLRNSSYGFGGQVVVELDPIGTGDNLTAAEKAEFNRARESARAPAGVDAAIYGTLQGDITEAKLAAEKLADIAKAAKEESERSQADLTAAIAALKKESAADEAQIQAAEDKLKEALATAVASEQILATEQRVVRLRLAAIDATQVAGEPVAPEARVNLAESQEKLAKAEVVATTNRSVLAEATAALSAIAQARAAKGGQSEAERMQGIMDEAGKRQTNLAKIEADLAVSSANVAARVDNLEKTTIAGSQTAIAAAQAEVEAARQEAAGLKVALEVAKADSAREAAASAEQKAALAQEQVMSLEKRLADIEQAHKVALAEATEAHSLTVAALEEANGRAALAAEVAQREAVEAAAQAAAKAKLEVEAAQRTILDRTYAEFTARKGLLEARLRAKEITQAAYLAEIEALEKEARGR